jgi:hypothetical protein
MNTNKIGNDWPDSEDHMEHAATKPDKVNIVLPKISGIKI